MSRPRVAFVVQRCGREVNGGAEAHCLLVASRMAAYWDTEILTTRAVEYTTWADHYPEGVEALDRTMVRRFSVDRPRDVEAFNRLSERIARNPGRASMAECRDWMEAQGPVSSALAAYIKDQGKAYDAFVFFTYLYATTYRLLPLVRDRAWLAPLAHDEWPIYLPMWDEFFRLPRGFVFNTEEEREFLRSRFPRTSFEGPVAGVAVDPPESADPERFRARYGIREPFLLYVGRIDPSKGCDELFSHFMELRQNETAPRKLVLLGKPVMDIPDHPDILFLGFVDERTKWDALSACDLLVMPSPHESLSMALLEAWTVGKPALVNGRCKVLVGQCRRANGGLWYEDFETFRVALERMDAPVRQTLGRQGMRYARERYAWPAIERMYLDCVGGGLA